MLTLNKIIDPIFYENQIKVYAPDLLQGLQSTLRGITDTQIIKDKCAEHFTDFSQARGISPTPIFDTSFYCIVSGINKEFAWQHFLLEGMAKGLSPSSIFDVVYYAQIAKIRYDQTVEDFLTVGLTADRNPSLFFDMAYYVSVVDPTITPEGALRDYVLKKKPKGISPSLYFDAEFYRLVCAKQGHAVPEGAELDNFILYGEKNLKIRPTPFFHNAFYIEQLPQPEKQRITQGSISAIRHYLMEGMAQGYNPSAFVDIQYYCTQTKTPTNEAFRSFLLQGTTADAFFSSPSPLFDAAYYSRQSFKNSSDQLTTIADTMATSNTTKLLRGYLLSMQKLQPEIPLLNPCVYFNRKYYSKLTGIAENAASFHFLTEGCKKGYNPSLYFDVAYYADQAKVPFENTLRHFLLFGLNYGYNPTPLFDIGFFISQLNSNEKDYIQSHFISAVEYFITTSNNGVISDPHTQFYSPSVFFNASYYLQQPTRTLPATLTDPIKRYEYFLQNDINLGVSTFELFNPNYYSGEAKVSLNGAFIDFIRRGAMAGLDSHYLFNTNYYKQQLAIKNPPLLQDIIDGKTTAIRHYVMLGGKQSSALASPPSSYDPCVIFDSVNYATLLPANRNPSTLLAYFLFPALEGHQQGEPYPLPFVFFDPNFYAQLTGVVLHGAQHFLEEGIKKGIDPSPFFDTDYYVKMTGIAPDKAFIDFIQKGAKAISPCPFFDNAYYLIQLKSLDLAAYTGIQDGEESALHYYLIKGMQKYAISPSPLFDINYYLAQRRTTKPDLTANQALYDFLIIGEAQGLIPTPYFDSDYYNSELPADQKAIVVSKSMSAIRNYLSYGQRALLSPTPFIDIAYYAQISKISKAEAVEHYFLTLITAQITQPIIQPPPPSSLFDNSYYQQYCEAKNISISKPIYFDDYMHYGLDPQHEREASPYISLSFYRLTTKISIHLSAARDFLVSGIKAGYSPSVYFNITFCKEKYSTQKQPIKNEDTLRDFLLNRLSNDQIGSPYFDAYYYSAEINKKAVPIQTLITPESALTHYRFNNEKYDPKSTINVNPTPYFEMGFYASQISNLDLIRILKNETLIEHFVLQGEKQGLNPCAFFETVFYAKKQKIPQTNTLQHYLLKDNQFNTDTSPFFNASFYRKFLLKNLVNLNKFNKTLLYYFLTIGEARGDSPSIVFVTDFYIQAIQGSVDEQLFKDSHLSAIRYMLFTETVDAYSPNFFFNPVYYRAQIAGKVPESIRAIRYYLENGDTPYHNPSIYFDNVFYREFFLKNPPKIISQNKMTLLAYFLEFGEALGHNCFPFFDAQFYQKQLDKNPNIQKSAVGSISLLRHFITVGLLNGLDPSSFFDTVCYLTQLSIFKLSLPTDNTPALVDYLTNKEPYHSIITPSFYFDNNFYGAQTLPQKTITIQQDAIDKQISLIRHFLLIGEQKELSPLPFFEPNNYYIKHLPLLVQTEYSLRNISAFRFFILYGDDYDTNPGPFFDTFFYGNQINVTLPIGQLFYRFLSQDEAKGISCSPFFDTDFYVNILATKIPVHISAIRYFIMNNGPDRQPSPFVDKEYYVSQNSAFNETSAYFIILHDFLVNQINIKNGYKITPFFDEVFYQGQLTSALLHDWMQSKVALICHFLTKGITEGISPTPIFDVDFCTQQLSDLTVKAIEQGATSAIREFLIHDNEDESNISTFSPEKTLQSSPFFDSVFYRMNGLVTVLTSQKNLTTAGTKDLVRAFLINSIHNQISKNTALPALFSPAPFVDMEYYAFAHHRSAQFTNYASVLRFFVSTGEAMGESPSSLFFTQYYIEILQNAGDPDVSKIISGEQSAIRHYLITCKKKGYVPTPFIDVPYYINELGSNSPVPTNTNTTSLTPVNIYSLVQYYFHHYLTGGASDISATIFFDSDYYQAQLNFYANCGVSEDQINISNPLTGMRHFLKTGQQQGLSPSAYFQTRYYSCKYSIPLNNSLQDFLTRGQNLKFESTPFLPSIYPLPNKIDDTYVTKVKNWNDAFGNFMPYIIDWILAGNENISINIGTTSLNTAGDCPFPSITLEGVRNLQSYYQTNPAYVELFSAYKRLSTLQQCAFPGANIQTYSITLTSLLELFKSNIDPKNLTEHQKNLQNSLKKILSLDHLIVNYRVDSASQIASLPLTDFISLMQKPMNGLATPGMPNAINTSIYQPFMNMAIKLMSTSPLLSNDNNSIISTTLYNKANNIVADVSLNYLNAYQTASPYINQVANGQISVRNNVLNVCDGENYQAIFGSLDYYNINENLTICSDAAYLFDLMRLIQTNFAESNNINSLNIRRPDLFEIALSAKDTFNTALYLQIVNYVLERHLIRLHKLPFDITGNTYQENVSAAQETTFSFLIEQALDESQLSHTLYNPPCALSLETSRVYFSQLGSSLFDFYSAIKVHDNFIKKFDDYNVAQEYLDISAVEILWLQTVLLSFQPGHPVDKDIINIFVVAPEGIQSESFLNQFLINGDIFSCQSNDFFSFIQSTRERCKKLIPYVNEVNSDNNAFYKQLYINTGDTFDPMTVSVNYDYKVEVINNVSLTRLKRLALTFFFAKKLGCSVDEIQKTMLALRIAQPALDAVSILKQIKDDVKTLALLKWISKTSSLSFNDIMQAIYPISAYDYQQFFKHSGTKKVNQNSPEGINRQNLTYGFSGNNILQAIIKLLNIPANATGNITSYLTPDEVTTLNSVVTTLKITYADFGLLISKILIPHFYTNGAIINWFMLVTSAAKLCNVSIPALFQLYHLVVANQASTYPSFLQGLYAYLVSENTYIQTSIYKIALLYSANLWLKNSALSISTVYSLIYPNQSASPTQANNAKLTRLSLDLCNLLKTFIQNPAAETTILSSLDNQVCQTLAVYYQTNFQTMLEIFSNIATLNPKQHVITCFIFSNPSLLTIGLDPSLQSLDLKLIEGIKINFNAISSLQNVINIINIFNLSATNQSGEFNDIKILCHVIGLTNSNGNISFKVTLDTIKTLTKLRDLQNTFQDNTNQFLETFQLHPVTSQPDKPNKDLSLKNPQENAEFLSLVNWDVDTYNMLCSLTFPKRLKREIPSPQNGNILQAKAGDVYFEFIESTPNPEEAGDSLGFDFVNASQAVVVSYLMTLSNKGNARQLLSSEIRQAFQTGKITTDIWEKLVASTASDAERKAAEQEYCCQQDVFILYITRLGEVFSSSSLPLGPRSAALYLQSTSIDVYLWQQANDANTLELVQYFNNNNPAEVEHILDTNGQPIPGEKVFFNLLELTSADYPPVCSMLNQISWLNQLMKLMAKIKSDKGIFSSINNLRNNSKKLLSGGKIDGLNSNQNKAANDTLLTQYNNDIDLLSSQLTLLIKNTLPDGKKALYTLSRKIETRKRDVLVTALLYIFNTMNSLDNKNSMQSAVTDVFGSATKKTPIQASDISEYILLDVETQGEVDTSLIVQATLSLQWYLQRCRLGLEVLSDNSRKNLLSIPDVWWSWIENYRMWQANRDILIYPENYIDPSLRTKTSQEFTEFTQGILQSNLDSTSVANAYRDYFHKITQLSALTYVDACQADTNTMYFFTCTSTSPTQYYFRNMKFQIDANNFMLENKIDWGYWKNIPASINAQLISSIYAFNRLFVFWVETKYKVVNSTHVDSGQSTTTSGTTPENTYFTYKICYTSQNTNGTWQIAQTIVEEDNKSLLDFFSNTGITDDTSNTNDTTTNVASSQTTTDLLSNKVIYIDSQYAVLIKTLNISEPYYLRLNKVWVNLDANNNIVIQYPWNDAYPKNDSAIKIYPIQYHINQYLTISSAGQVSDSFPNYNNSYNHLFSSPFQTNNKGKFLNLVGKFQPAKWLPLPPTVDLSASLKQDDITVLLDPLNNSWVDLIRVTASSSKYCIFSTSQSAYLIIPNKNGNSFQYISLSSATAMHTLSQAIFLSSNQNDLDNFFSKVNQQNLEDNFFKEYSPSNEVYYRGHNNQNPDTGTLNFSGAFNSYYWELLFFVPFYIANLLNGKQQFSDARNWYHRIFYPYNLSGQNNPLFLFQPFQTINPSLNLSSYSDILNASNNYPFDPHAIAKLRPIAYMKAIVMNYIKNLIDWGDSLFTEDTRETINQATNLYIMANDLLGKEPQGLGMLKPSRASITLGDYYAESDDTKSMVISAAFNTVTIGIFAFLENQFSQQFSQNTFIYPSETLTSVNFNVLNPYFSIPENQEFIAYWGRVSDRLFKIRCSRNIEGVKQQLALFSPEIDVHQLVRAAATGGLNINSLLGGSPVPIYRFNTLVAYAKDFINQVIQLGSMLQSMLERQDAENFSLLMNSQQETLLNLMSVGKQQQINEATYEIEQIKSSIAEATQRAEYYSTKKRLQMEVDALNMTYTAGAVNLISAGVSVLSAAAAFIIPQFQAGFAAIGPYDTVEDGGEEAGGALEAFSQAAFIGAMGLQTIAGGLQTSASYDLRDDDWAQQATEANNEITVLTNQQFGAQVRLLVAQNDYDTHQLSIKNLQAVEQFYQNKFSNQAFYQWMILQLMPLHQNVYNMAYAMLQRVLTAYAYEVPQDKNSYAQLLSYNANYKGMLAGEVLQDQLNRFQNAYVTNNSRLFNVTKIVSLKNLSVFYSTTNSPLKGEGDYISKFKTPTNYDVSFTLSADYFNTDFNCLSNRRIKFIQVSVPSLTGPYQSLNLVFRRTDIPKPYNGLYSYASIQTQIIVSSGVNDSGTLEGLSSSRYLPFEGMPLDDSKWQLSVGNSDNVDQKKIQSITDVILTIQYVAESGTPNSNTNNSTTVDISAADLANNEAFANAYQSRSSTTGTSLSSRKPPSYLQSGLYAKKSTSSTSSSSSSINNTAGKF